MEILSAVIMVFFVIIAVLLILLVLAQGEDGDNLGGIFAGGSGSALGSRSGNILTRVTTILGALFLVVSLGLALISRSPSGAGVERAGRSYIPESGHEWVDQPRITPENISPPNP